MFENTEVSFTGTPMLVRFRQADRVNVTAADIERISKFGFVAVFTEFMPTVLDGDEANHA